MTDRSRSAARRRLLAVPLLAAVVLSGCAWDLHGRPVREQEPLVLPSMVVRAPTPSKGWSVARRFDATVRVYQLTHVDAAGELDERIVVGEVDGTFENESEARERARLAQEAAAQTGDPSAAIVDLPSTAVPRFGASAVHLALRATESDAHGGEAPTRRTGWAYLLAFANPSSPGRITLVHYVARTDEARGEEAPPAAAIAERWRALLAGIELRSDAAAGVKGAASAGGFPKQMEPGLARRSLTLPRGAFQWSLSRDRWLDHGGFDGSWALRVGITDRLELSAPGQLKYSFGDPDALARPELAVGAGWVGFSHDAVAGSTWGFGANAAARKRFGADLAWRAALGLVWAHESRTGHEALGGGATAGIVWDVHRWVTLGVEAGHARGLAGVEKSSMTWVGGRATPLVTVHLSPLDVGLDGAVAWDGGEPGVLAGFSLRLTL